MDAKACSCEGTVATEWAVRAAASTHKRHDSYTVSHSNGVARLSAEIGRQMGLPDEQTWLLELASLVHDIGKIEVPRSIIEKPGRLTESEYEIVKDHCEAGYEILQVIPTPWPIAEIARQHHERLDGSGYPRGLKGAEILFEAQIVAVADVTESMLSRRPYRSAHGLDFVMGHIAELRGEKLNAAAVDACIHLFREGGYQVAPHGGAGL